MDGIRTLFLCGVTVLLAGAGCADALATVMGNVFCDQCRDGHRTMFDLPINGAKVAVECTGSDGQITMSKQETTDLIGNFMMKFDGTPDLSGCTARVTDSPQDSDCKIVGSSSKPLSLSFRLFSMEVYTVESLFFQPAKPMSFCPNSPPKNSSPNSPPQNSPPQNSSPNSPPKNSSPKISLPPLPSIKASACPYEYWVNPAYNCYWRLARPDTTVSLAFGEEAAKKYGRNMTLWEGLYGRGDVYRTLLREATASLLNSYNSFQFQYNTLSVFLHMNSALQGSPQDALKQALYFKRANTGGGKIKCSLTPCK